MADTLSGQVAIITGGASGIGRALAHELARRGAEVVLADRQGAVAEEVARNISSSGGRARAVELDVRNFAAIKRVAEDTVSRSGRIDFLFNNAGIAVGGEMDNYTLEDFDEVFDVNLRGVAYGILAVYPIMIEQRSGHIVNTASIAGLVAAGLEGSYTASKHAVVGLTKALRMEAKRHGVRASVFCPGVIRTDILSGGKYGRIKMEGISRDKLLETWERFRPMDASLFARKAMDAVLRNDAIIIVPGWWKIAWYLDRLAPTLSMKVWETLLERFRIEMQAEGATPSRETNGRGASAQAS